MDPQRTGKERTHATVLSSPDAELDRIRRGVEFGFRGAVQVPVPPTGGPDNAGPVRERRLVQRLEQARQLLAPREPNEKPAESQALRLLQTLLEDRTETDDGPGTYDVLLDPAPEGDRRVATHSLKTEARQLIGGMSAQGRQAYELLAGKAARVQFDAALATGDWRAIEEVARQSLHTSAGYDATMALGLRELDLGEPLAAAQRSRRCAIGRKLGHRVSRCCHCDWLWLGDSPAATTVVAKC